MNTQPDVKKLIQQTQQYEFVDGLREMQLAVMMAAIGLTAWFVFDLIGIWMPVLAGWMRTIGAWTGLSIQLVVLLPALLALVALLAMRFARRRWLWRESGLVKPNRQIVPLRVTLISVGVLLAGIALGVLLQVIFPVGDLFLMKMIYIASGWSFGYTLITMGNILGLSRLRRVGLFGAVVPTLLIVLPLTIGQMVLIWGLIWGAALGISGMGPLRQKIQAAREEPL